MSRIFLALLAGLLIAAPYELTAKQVRHHAAQAQAKQPRTPGTPVAACALGAAGGVACGFSDLSLPPRALADTDTMQLCQDPTGCWAGESTVQINQAPLSYWKTYFLSKLSGTAPIVVNNGVVSCPTCGTSTGGVTGLTLSPGLTVVPGTYNNGTGTPATIVNGSTISTQLFYEAHSANYTVLATDGGKLMEATTNNITFTLPAPGAIGTSSYAFASSAGAGSAQGTYNLSTPSGTIYGCGPIGSTIIVSYDVVVVPTGGNWKCSSASVPNQYPVTWGPNQDLTKAPLPVLRRAQSWQLLNLICVPGGLPPSPATLDLWWAPDNTAASAVTSCGSCVHVTTTACNAAGTSGTLQAGMYTAPLTIPAGGSVWLVGSGSGWQGGGTTLAGVSGLMQISAIP